MRGPTFDITIGKDGKVKVKVHGVSGKECVRLTDMIAQIVGKEESRQLTSEYLGGEPGLVRNTAVTQVRSGQQ